MLGAPPSSSGSVLDHRSLPPVFESRRVSLPCATTLVKPAHMQKIVSYRKLRSIDVEAFKHGIVVSSMLQTTQGNVDGLVTAFTNGLTSLIDKHAPLRTRTITERPDCPWYTDTLHEAKDLRRKLERRWKNRLTVTTKYIEINVLW